MDWIHSHFDKFFSVVSLGIYIGTTWVFEGIGFLTLTLLQIPVTSDISSWNAIIAQWVGIITAILVLFYWIKKIKSIDAETKVKNTEAKIKEEELREKTLNNDQAETFYNKAMRDEKIENPVKTKRKKE